VPWNYSAAPEASQTESAKWLPVGLKITKTFTDDSGTEIVTVDTTVEDAIENSEEGFPMEYYQALQTLFAEQLNSIFSHADGTTVNYAQGLVFGQALERGLATARMLAKRSTEY
jgi:hypothetical protein